MMPLNFAYESSSPRSTCIPPNMPSPVSPTYTSYSVPSPFSSGSSASYRNRSPISESFDSMPDAEHLSGVIDDYTINYAPPATSLPAYSDLGYINSGSVQDFDYNMMNWSTGEVATSPKRQPPPPPPPHPQQFLQHTSYRSVSSHDAERMKNLALYIPPASPTVLHAQQHNRSPAVIHSPTPIPILSQVPPHHSSSLTHTNSYPPSQAQRVQQSHRPSQSHVDDQFFDVDMDDWRPSPMTSHHAHFPPAYSHSQSHPIAMAQMYANGTAHDIRIDQSQPAMGGGGAIRRSVSDFSPGVANNGLRIKQEEIDMYTSLGPYGAHTQSPRQSHIFDLSAPVKVPVSLHTQSPHNQTVPLSPTYYTRSGHPEHHIQPHAQQVYAIHPPELSPSHSEPCMPRSGFDAPVSDVGFAADDVRYETGYGAASVDSGYGDVCDPQFVTGCGILEKDVEVHREAELEEGWETGRRGMAPEFVEGGRAGDDGEADADAEGEDDVDGYSSPGYVAQHGDPRVESPDPQDELQRQAEVAQEDEEEQDEDDLESEEDDSHDPEFVLRRPRRHTYSYTEGRSLRSTRYNPYPSYPSASPTSADSRYPDDYAQQYTGQGPVRTQRSYSRTSISPSNSESYSPISVGSNGPSRRRSRPTSTLPIPVPVPNLTKKSRGRRVPTMEDFEPEEEVPPKGRKKSAGTSAKAMRTYTCDVDGCGKLFARGEHLKRHIRSIHTYEKPHRCPYPGCGKDFSRHDNLGQHMRVHKDYVPPKDGQNGYKA
ncbi:hypothetical protein Hypma_008446 [Hypsizygus marmoreus]|uniref:C2H2-type domain-containing protein n=1 Tax=Hypsizygus marmoreus TaxID=39966 RepID=A0A369JVE3_HYPMA|nr:hypothetical protein Hypma_008446 [Hypsizygus marmoreus]